MRLPGRASCQLIGCLCHAKSKRHDAFLPRRNSPFFASHFLPPEYFVCNAWEMVLRRVCAESHRRNHPSRILMLLLKRKPCRGSSNRGMCQCEMLPMDSLDKSRLVDKRDLKITCRLGANRKAERLFARSPRRRSQIQSPYENPRERLSGGRTTLQVTRSFVPSCSSTSRVSVGRLLQRNECTSSSR